MDISIQNDFELRSNADVLIVLVSEKNASPVTSPLPEAVVDKYQKAVALGDLSGKCGELVCCYLDDAPEKRVIFLGVGEEEKLKIEGFRRVLSKAFLHCLNHKWKSFNFICLKTSVWEELETLAVSIETAHLTDYSHDAYKSEANRAFHFSNATFYSTIKGDDHSKVLTRVTGISEGINLTRMLVDKNADDITPSELISQSKTLEKKFAKVKVKTIEGKDLLKENLGLIHAVGRGSSYDSALVALEYRGAKDKSEKPVCFVGKGITYDTGGLSIKTTSGMETMRSDMGGSGVIVGLIQAIAALELPINVVGILAAAENAVASKSFKVGDVYTGYSGVSVEIKNTDAEGRLVLADGLAYAAKNYNPRYLIDVATLTGAAEVALGGVRAALFSNNEDLADKLFQVGEQSGELLWPLPHDEEYEKLLVSDVADIKNLATRKGSLIFSGMFLKRFAGECDWAHIDIAGVAFLDKPKYYHRSNATGYGVRLLTSFLESLL